jgi:hypothetical protein
MLCIPSPGLHGTPLATHSENEPVSRILSTSALYACSAFLRELVPHCSFLSPIPERAPAHASTEGWPLQLTSPPVKVSTLSKVNSHPFVLTCACHEHCAAADTCKSACKGHVQESINMSGCLGAEQFKASSTHMQLFLTCFGTSLVLF